VSTVAALANHLSLAGAAPARGRLERAMRDPRRAQHAILARTLRANAETAFGREHGFAAIRSAAEYARRVPLRDHDEMSPWISRICAGEMGILTADPVRFVEPSGGSSGYTKQIPYTKALLEEFSAATMAWVFDLLLHRPALRGGHAYWAVSPPGRRAARTDGGVPIGMEHDSDYFPAPIRALLERTFAVPRAVGRAPDIESCRYLTLRALLALPDLRLISVWSPSFLTLLASALDEHFERLVHDMDRGTISLDLDPFLRVVLERALPARPAEARLLHLRFGRTPPRDLGALWTRLALISCWSDGHASRALDGMRHRFPAVEVQGKGLLATEGAVSIPLLHAHAPVAAVTSHYLEFLPDDGTDTTCAVDELDRGGTYQVVLTTGGGLYRYRLKDLVRVEGHLHRAPLISFQGRADRASDLAGEKLTPALVERALSAAMRELSVGAPFAMIAPSWEPSPHYMLFVEAEPAAAARLAAAVERGLGAAHHYALCRALGQLAPVQGVAIRGGERAYERACAERGQRSGAIKPPALEPALGWDRHFEACKVA
jgi:hypothetical protein